MKLDYLNISFVYRNDLNSDGFKAISLKMSGIPINAEL